MKTYNFDKVIDRKGTDCAKWDGYQGIFGTDDVLPLWVADMDFQTPDFIIDALKKRLEHDILGYSVRSDSFFLATKNWVKRHGNWDIKSHELCFTPGIVPALNFAVNAFTQPGDKILINTPVYHPFFFAVNDHNRQLVESSLIEDKGYYTLDFEDIEKKLADGVKMYIFCSPHNPVGRVWTKNELEKIGELCVKYNVLLISDEIHSDLVFKPNQHIHMASISEKIAQKTLTFIAPSKTFNLAGVSTSVAHSSNADILCMFNSYIAKMHLSMGTIFGDIALEAAYNFGDDWLEQLLSYLDENFEYIIRFLENHIPQIKTLKPEGTYLMWLDCRDLGMTNKNLTDFMVNKAKLAMNPGTLFGIDGAGFMRLNAAAPRSILEEAMQRLKNAISARSIHYTSSENHL